MHAAATPDHPAAVAAGTPNHPNTCCPHVHASSPHFQTLVGLLRSYALCGSTARSLFGSAKLAALLKNDFLQVGRAGLHGRPQGSAQAHACTDRLLSCQSAG